MLETSAKGAQPRGEEAQRVLSVFAASLKNPTLVRGGGARRRGAVASACSFAVEHLGGRLCERAGWQTCALSALSTCPSMLPRPNYHVQETPPAIEDMLSWNTLTPHYEEDVIYALNSASVARHFGMDPVSAQVRVWEWRKPCMGPVSAQVGV